MAISRRLALILSLGTILFSFLFTRVSAAGSDYGNDIHTVRHPSDTADCKREHLDKGDQCREDNDLFEDDDFDDTYKIVNNIAITLSASGSILQPDAEESDDIPSSEEEIGNMLIVGH
ncbi:hypothetical protein E5676_scaffold552G00150 [Cucumis melo var. makuwa]|uniref:Uncharacterized protein n=2 Tax=Cucumis melo TaxID=3656 RepID=A0A5D3CVV2_CUCMM|nr:hypothetical protein E6C27_scaffold24G002830 [Cucumis melo var. makuwa]TYK14536.1 hypothetical protein E5676_scaffold552G00150 [Cucumis melo var. makuwa]